jgi:hypothetical protein
VYVIPKYRFSFAGESAQTFDHRHLSEADMQPAACLDLPKKINSRLIVSDDTASWVQIIESAKELLLDEAPSLPYKITTHYTYTNRATQRLEDLPGFIAPSALHPFFKMKKTHTTTITTTTNNNK